MISHSRVHSCEISDWGMAPRFGTLSLVSLVFLEPLDPLDPLGWPYNITRPPAPWSRPFWSDPCLLALGLGSACLPNVRIWHFAWNPNPVSFFHPNPGCLPLCQTPTLAVPCLGTPTLGVWLQIWCLAPTLGHGSNPGCIQTLTHSSVSDIQLYNLVLGSTIVGSVWAVTLMACSPPPPVPLRVEAVAIDPVWVNPSGYCCL